MSDRSKKVGLPAKRRMRHDRHFVDELSQRMGEGIGRMVRVTAISANTDQPRTNLGDLDDLIASISKHGVLEPLLVRPKEGGYQLVSGERRFHAAMQVGLSELPCIELDVNDDEALEIALVENLQRRDLNAFEEAEGFRTLVHKYGYTHEQVADAIGRSRVTITESLKILDIPDHIRTQCRHADITAKGMLLEIAKAEDPQLMQRLIEEIVDHRLDRAALRARRQQLVDGPVADPSPPTSGSGRAGPYRFRFRAPDRPYSLSMSFRTDREPDPQQVIAALEEVLQELRATLDKD